MITKPSVKDFEITNGKILLKIDPLEKKSRGGINLMTQLTQPIDRATIVGVSPTGISKEVVHTPGKQYIRSKFKYVELNNEEYHVGDRVVFNYHQQDFMEFEEGTFVAVEKSSIFCILENEDDLPDHVKEKLK